MPVSSRDYRALLSGCCSMIRCLFRRRRGVCLGSARGLEALGT